MSHLKACNLQESTSMVSSSKNSGEGIWFQNYRLVGWALDTTGRRLIDDILQIAAFTPTKTFSQHIMPLDDLNPTRRRKHSIKYDNTGRSRMLKHAQSNQFLSTKSDVSALTDFLTWLESIKGDETAGIILLYYEGRKSSPAMLLEALRRYRLVQRFNDIVKAFVNAFSIVQGRYPFTTRAFTLRFVAKVLVNRPDEIFRSARERAEVTYRIAEELTRDDRFLQNDIVRREETVVDFILPFSKAVLSEEHETVALKKVLYLQGSFRPIFIELFRASRQERQHATYLRRLLADSGVHYANVENAYNNGAKVGLEKYLEIKIVKGTRNEICELVHILDRFFDPKKEAVKTFPRLHKYVWRNKCNDWPKQTEPTTSSSKPTGEDGETSPQKQSKELQ